MNRDRIEIMIAGIDDRHLRECEQYAPLSGPADPERITNMNEKKKLSRRFVSVLLAAVLLLALGATAYGIGVSRYQQEQERIRQELRIMENKVRDYREYELTEDESDAGFQLLSTYNNGDIQIVYFSISPVEEETVRLLDGIDAGRKDAPLTLQLPNLYLDGEAVCVPASAHTSYRESYDPEMKTLTLRSNIKTPAGGSFRIDVRQLDVPEGAKSEEDCSVLIDYGGAEIEVTDVTERRLWFPQPLRFENAETGGQGELIGVSVSAGSFVWLLRHDGMDDMYFLHEFSDEQQREDYLNFERSWLQAIDAVEQTTVLQFADGKTMDGFGALRSEVKDGTVRDIWIADASTLPIDALVSVSIGGQTWFFDND